MKGFNSFSGWQGPVLTDSGGFQVFSLIHRNKSKSNYISDAGCSFVDPTNGKYSFLSPESSQYIQHAIGSDIRVVLDEPLIDNASLADIKRSVIRTTLWAKRAKNTFLKILNVSESDFNKNKSNRPLLCAVIQGANSFEWRKKSAEALIDIGFDVYGFGGIPIKSKLLWRNEKSYKFNKEMINYVANLIPSNKIRYGLGIGTPDDLEIAYEAGWDIFDTVLPTRNARHGYLYVNKGLGDVSYKNFDVLHIKSLRYKFSNEKIDKSFKNPPYPNLTRSYLRYLFKINDPIGKRIATMHNLYFYNKFMEYLTNK